MMTSAVKASILCCFVDLDYIKVGLNDFSGVQILVSTFKGDDPWDRRTVSRHESGNRYVWKEHHNPAVRKSALARTPPSNRKTILAGVTDTMKMKIRTRAGSVGHGCKRIIVPLPQY